ncbi:MAG TPA: HEAT repeat domain-containing protein [Steroidobacteraceae bacterium]|nr:HEAT repeat domain-containing protein [Steroidobacteraceae bacterium]
MSFFSTMKAERLIAEIKASGDPTSPTARKALAKLAGMGVGAIEPIIEALPTADKQETLGYVEVLAALIDTRTFAQVARGLSESNPRAVAGIAWALSSSKNYPPSMLLDLLSAEDIAKPAVLDVISAHKSRFSVRELLTAAYSQEPNEKAALFRIVGEIADESAVPDLISRVEGKDPIARVHIMNVLSRFNTPEVSRAIQTQLRDPNKMVRQAALNALTRVEGPINIEQVCKLLRDPEIDVQNRAVEVVIKANHPDTTKYLVDVLKDENEYARRAAVEVLNEIGTPKSVKHLLEAIKDDDWWVRSRAADALGKIGGPKVVEAVLALVKDEDEDLRRAAIEILNQTKDERAVNHLIEATRDPDWWVSERAIDALAEIGTKRAVPRLLEMLQSDATRSIPVVVRALGKLGDHKVIEPVLKALERPEKEIRVEAINVLAKLADERRVEHIRVQLQAQTQNPDATVQQAASRALQELDDRYSSSMVAANQKAERLAEPAKTLLMDNRELEAVVKSAEAAVAQRLDIATLKPGDIIEGRYKFIEKIGKGAFGTVLLMEDTVVDERLILKFLNQNVAQDEEMMKRFVHELRYSRKITHRNVIRIYDFLYVRGNYAISMEYFPSHTLGAEIVNEKPVALKRAVRFAMDICTGMSVAHQVGIVHRDLKPANVLINEEGLLKIVDFGVAAAHREGDTQLTKTGYVIGSPKSMAPEQILGKKVDEKADVYSTGVIMYEMFTGVPPYHRGDHMSVMYQHVQGKARPPHEINPSLPPALSALVIKAMSVDKAKRYNSMEELRLELEKFQ